MTMMMMMTTMITKGCGGKVSSGIGANLPSSAGGFSRRKRVSLGVSVWGGWVTHRGSAGGAILMRGSGTIITIIIISTGVAILIRGFVMLDT